MSSLLDKLNLRPQERRLVVIVSVIVFIALNLGLVFPRFGEWGKTQQRTIDAEKKLHQFQDEIARQTNYNKELQELQNNGQSVGTEEQALRLQQEVGSQAALSGVGINSISPVNRSGGGRTNAFFDEQSLVLNIITGEKELIEFLYSLASHESLTRVKSMNLAPDPARMKLQGTLTLTKSFQRRVVKPAATSTNAPKSSSTTAGAKSPASAPTKGADKAPPATKGSVTNIPPKGMNAVKKT